MNIFVAFFILLLLLAGVTPTAVKDFPLIGKSSSEKFSPQTRSFSTLLTYA